MERVEVQQGKELVLWLMGVLVADSKLQLIVLVMVNLREMMVGELSKMRTESQNPQVSHASHRMLLVCKRWSDHIFMQVVRHFLLEQ